MNMRHFVCLTVFLLALFPIEGTAQEHTLQGRVVDAETCRLLRFRFDGSCNNYYMTLGLIPYATSIEFQLEYDYGKGAASVSHLAVCGSNDFLFYHILLFAIEGDKQSRSKLKGSGPNIVTALTEAGYDEKLWSKYDIIRRTREEERAAFGE